MAINYHHGSNRHTQDGPRVALPLLMGLSHPQSLLDVGCGTGTWLKAALELGIDDIFGVDGIELPDREFLVSKSFFRKMDLAGGWNLERRFDLAICLEVAEHLPADSAEQLVKSLTLHADTILFSAACPGQEGEGHINCQWPGYWQALFNHHQFRCEDSLRWKIWEQDAVEPWYRQNLFLATKDAGQAGSEPRLQRVLHPSMFAGNAMPDMAKIRHGIIDQVEAGSQTVGWYLSIPFRGMLAKLRRAGRTVK
jgi:SAM-dependent methyltransferase